MSRLIEFYRGSGTDSERRTLGMIWGYSHGQWEAKHDFIQWLFPLRAPSRFNPDAPLLTDADVAEFRADPALRENLRHSLVLFLDFLGLRLEGSRVLETEEFNRNGVFNGPNHNWLRITRVLTCTRSLGLEREGRAFFAFLTQLREEGRSGITAESFEYWADAATGVLSD